MKGLGQDPRSYAVGDKSPPVYPEQYLQQQKMSAQEELIRMQYMANLPPQMRFALSSQSDLSSRAIHVMATALELYDHYMPARETRPPRRFMRNTSPGRIAKATMEVLFWIATAAFIVGWVLLPLAIKIGTVLWTWALT